MIKDLWNKYRELISYVFWGGMTTLVNWVVYTAAVSVTSMHTSIANLIAWIAAVAFAFVTNKIFVFRSRTHEFRAVVKEAALFVGGRAFSGVVEIGGMALMTDLLGWHTAIFGIRDSVPKLVISVVVLILNFIVSKWLVFRKPAKPEETEEKPHA